MQPFSPLHINAEINDLAGNNGLGRYILLPGSDGRSKEISQFFDNLVVKSHPRGHNLYLGTLTHEGQTIDVATIASGMGCPSMEIILHELFYLGGKRFLRVGTAGSLQEMIKLGDIIHVQASVRDEYTSTDYVPLAIPAVSSFEFAAPILLSAKKLGLDTQLHAGIVHCKSSFYAREFGAGPKRNENNAYIDLLSNCGVLASEMETATLFIQSQLYDHTLRKSGKGPVNRVLAGAILGIIAVPPHTFSTPSQATLTTNNLISLALEVVKTLAVSELNTLTRAKTEVKDQFERIVEY